MLNRRTWLSSIAGMFAVCGQRTVRKKQIEILGRDADNPERMRQALITYIGPGSLVSPFDFLVMTGFSTKEASNILEEAKNVEQTQLAV